MKLLSKAEIKKKGDGQLKSEIDFAVKASKLLKKERIALNKHKTERLEEMQEIEDSFVEFLREKTAKRNGILNEIKTAKKKKDTLMQPLLTLEVEVNHKLEQVKERQAEVKRIDMENSMKNEVFLKKERELNEKERKLELLLVEIEEERASLKADIVKYKAEKEAEVKQVEESFSKFLKEKTLERSKILEDIKIAKDQRKRLIEPLQEMELEINKRSDLVSRKEVEVSKIQTDNIVKEGEFFEREKVLMGREKKVSKAEVKLKKDSVDLASKKKEVENMEQLFVKEIQQQKDALRKEKKKLQETELQLIAKQRSVDVAKASYENGVEQNKKVAISLQDQRETLEREFERLKNR